MISIREYGGEEFITFMIHARLEKNEVDVNFGSFRLVSVGLIPDVFLILPILEATIRALQ